jgi:retron-type reverse transcriptase
MIVEPRFERLFCHDSYANRVGKGTHAALNRLQALALRHRYVLRCDIVRHFPSVDHQILLDVVSRVVPEPDVMALGRAILASGADVDQDDAPTPFPGDDLLALCRPRGLPIGNLTSQFWSNCYLHPFDEFVRRELRCRSYVRYVDDFALFADDKGTLHEWKSAVSRRLSRYRLFIHGNQAQPVPVTGGIPWLGFVVYPTHRRLKRRKVVHATRRLRAAFVRYQDRQLERKELNAKLRGWIQHARHGDTWGLRRHMFSQPWCTARVVSAH